MCKEPHRNSVISTSFLLKSHTTLKKFNIYTRPKSVHVSVCVSLASDSSETIEFIIIKLGMVTASDIVMHHVLIILTLTFIQGHIDVNDERLFQKLYKGK